MSVQTHFSVVQLRNYLNEHIAEGRENHAAALDQRGLAWLFTKAEAVPSLDVRLSAPHQGDGTHDAERVFIRAVF